MITKVEAIPETNENPSVPDDLLQHLAETMRALRNQSQPRRRSTRPRSNGRENGDSFGQEAIRASILHMLQPGDLICDLSAFEAARTLPPGETLIWLDPPAQGASEALLTLLGVALTLQAQSAMRLAPRAGRSSAILLVLLPDASRRSARWKSVLQLATRKYLPTVFVSLPPETGKGVRFTKQSQVAGLPSIPADAADAVALCRVLWESCLRARSGDGPTLIETVRWQLSRRRDDPLERHFQLLRARDLEQK